jgi:small basic protein (TIGR04137 family)
LNRLEQAFRVRFQAGKQDLKGKISSLPERFDLVCSPLVFYRSFNRRKFMSQHRSLRAASTLGGKRNVLKRFERTELLKKRGQWKDGDRITGLRKTKPDV